MKFAALFFFLLLAQSIFLGAFHFSYHEPWRDEVQHLLLAQKIVGINELIRALRFEGHPPLLHLMYKGLLHLAEPAAVLAIVAAVGYFALGMATFALALRTIARPLTALLVSLGASWSYAVFYELGVVSRGYGLGMAFALGGLAFWIAEQKKSSAWWHALGVLAMVAAIHTSVHAAVLACCFTVPLFIRWTIDRKRALLVRTAVPMVFALLCLLFIVREHPDRMPSPVAATPAGVGEKLVHANHAWKRGGHVDGMSDYMHNVFYEYGFPTNWWPVDYSLFLKQLGGSAFMALLALTILRLVTAQEQWREHCLLLVGLLFTFITYGFFLRYLHTAAFRHQLFLLHPLFLFCTLFWLHDRPRTVRNGFARGSLRTRANGAMAHAAAVCIGILFIFQWGANVSAVTSDRALPFSATALLKDAIPNSEKSLIAVDTDYVATALVMWLPRARFFSTMDNAREFTYVVWDRARHDRRSRRANLFQQLCRQAADDASLVIYYLDSYPAVERNYRLRELMPRPAYPSTVAVRDENLRAYTVECPHAAEAKRPRLAETLLDPPDNAVF